MTHEEFVSQRMKISDSELIDKAEKAVSELCKTGGRSFAMTVPPRLDDTDIILSELISRYKNLKDKPQRIKINPHSEASLPEELTHKLKMPPRFVICQMSEPSLMVISIDTRGAASLSNNRNVAMYFADQGGADEFIEKVIHPRGAAHWFSFDITKP